MLRKDLILRQFEAFGKVLAQLLQLRRNGAFEEFEKEFEKASTTFLETEFANIETLSQAAFETYAMGLEVNKKKILAHLLYERMLLCDELKLTEKANLFALKSKIAYELYQADQTHTEFDLDAHYKLAELNKRIN